MEEVESKFSFMDLFTTSSFFNFKKKGQFSTCAGSSFSFIFIASFMGYGIYSMVRALQQSPDSAIVNEQIIASYRSLQFNITKDQVNPFSFMVSIKSANNATQYIDLNNQSASYFQISATEKYRENITSPLTLRTILLQPCRSDIWSYNNTNIYNASTILQLNNSLCPVQNQNFQLFGSINGNAFKYLKISVQACLNTSNITCVNQNQIDAIEVKFGEFLLNVYFIIPIVNPNNATTLDFELEDKNFISFTQKSPTTGNIYFSPLQVEVDNDYLSLSFNRNTQNRTFYNTATQTVAQRSTVLSNNQFAKIYFRSKEQFQSIYYISYPKIDDIFSAISGYFGFIIFIMLFLKGYNKYNCNLAIGKVFLKTNRNNEIQSSNFTIFSYIGHYFKKFGRCICCCCLPARVGNDANLNLEDNLDQIRDQTVNIVDHMFSAELLMKRVKLLEKYVDLLIEEVTDPIRKLAISGMPLNVNLTLTLTNAQTQLDEIQRKFGIRNHLQAELGQSQVDVNDRQN